MSARSSVAGRRWTVPLILGAAGVVMVLAGCKATTRYSLEIDVLSYIPEEELTREWDAQDTIPDRIVFLPYLEGGYTEGIALEVPAPDDPGVEDLTLLFEIDADVFNRENGTEGVLKQVRFRLFIAPMEIDNVYDDEHVVFDFRVDDIPPRGSEKVSGTRTIRRGDPKFEILRTGKFRLGADGYFESDADVRLGYRLNTMRIAVSVRPFSFLP